MERYIPVVKVNAPEEIDEILLGLDRIGIHTAEITFRTAAAEEAIKRARKLFPNAHIGAGTVINYEQCATAIEAGAEFIVSPGFSEEVGMLCIKSGIPYYPGVATPTEIMKALSLGFTTLKFFPANLYGGVKALKAFAGPFPQVRFIPTGGVNRENIEEFLALKNVIAVGGSFFVEEALRKE